MQLFSRPRRPAPPTAQPEGDRQPQHQGAKRDGERGQHDRGRQAQLFERHHDPDRDHEDAQGAAQQARTGQPGIDRCQQRGPPQKVADQEAERSTSSATRKRGTNRKNSSTSP